jgi:chromosome segregation ATPase
MHGRRILYLPEHFQALLATLAKAKADLSEQHFQHLCELADLNAEVRNLRDQVAELREVVSLLVSTRRAEAETDVAQLRAQLTALLGRLERRRDPNTPLH